MSKRKYLSKSISTPKSEFILSVQEKIQNKIEKDIQKDMKKYAKKFGFNYEDMMLWHEIIKFDMLIAMEGNILYPRG
jgi:hypothetical protein